MFSNKLASEVDAVLGIGGEDLDIQQVSIAARGRCPIRLDTNPERLERIELARSVVNRAVDEDWSVYGVTTGFGGLANELVPSELAQASQRNLLSFLATGAGKPINKRHTRAAMTLRANVLMKGCSGVRLEIIERLIHFLNNDAVPVVRELGSIGASGDLVPLAAIARAITGQSGYVHVAIGDRVIPGAEALAELGLEPLELLPKEGLAIVNGTSFSSAIAANCVYEARKLMALTLGAQAMMLRALKVQPEPFDEFVHRCKPHPGQIWTAGIMRELLAEGLQHTNGKPVHVQDRYSLRCLPQYIGPIFEGLARIENVVKTEMNSVSDNPLVDSENGKFYQSGNFLGQYIAIAMDDLRRDIGLMAKHLDVQIATLVAPEFNHGLPPSLRGNDKLSYNMGMKGLQITGNSIMPMLTYYGNPLVTHFPTHAEQFNQNVNGLSWGAANLAWDSLELFRHYMSVALIFSVQALDLRAHASFDHYDGRALLGRKCLPFYTAVYEVMNCKPGKDRPFLFNDSDQWLEEQIMAISADIYSNGEIANCVAEVLDSFDNHQF